MFHNLISSVTQLIFLVFPSLSLELDWLEWSLTRQYPNSVSYKTKIITYAME